jgi:BTB/POZ domain-containing protein KCTD8/12/16
LCREVFGDILNESYYAFCLEDRYSSRFVLRHCSLEQAFDKLIEANFILKSVTGSSTPSVEMNSKSDLHINENKLHNYNEFVFIRFK